VNTTASSLFNLSGKTVLLTGAAGFLGRTMAETLLTNGATVVAIGRSERLQALTEEWTARHGPRRAHSYLIDMYDLPALAALMDRILAEHPFIEVLVNNAHELGPKTGFNTAAGSLENADFKQWQDHLMAGVYWPSLLVQKLGPGMKQHRRGSIINISTMYAVVAPNPELYAGTSFINPPGYSVSKAAMLAFTRYVASFWGPHGIRANAILPGPISNTEENTGNSVAKDDPFVERLKLRTCLRRIGKPVDLSGPLLFLASDASQFVTGQGLSVDGGWTIT
jgi:NAD(P)-dependent dehydrogenase (short-subunit alcohol dehydrogenase family)